jgi:predicted thioesterase
VARDTASTPKPERERAATLSREVTLADTAAAWGADFPPAASTPFVLGLGEVTCHQAVVDDLEEGEITVGTAARIEHLVPSKVGSRLTAYARLIAASGRRFEFEVEVFDGDELVARIAHTRAAVRRQRIIDRLDAFGKTEAGG